MNNGSSKFFIGIVVMIAVLAALSDVIFTLFGLTPKLADIQAPINILPTSINEDVITSIGERASKYLLLSPDQFEEGREPETVTPTPTPSGSNEIIQ